MMNINKISFSLIFALVSLSLFAQINTKPSNYSEAIQQGDNAFKRAEYTTAIEKYRIAETFDQEQWKIVQERIEKVYHAIDSTLAYSKAIQRELEELKRAKPPQPAPNVVSENQANDIKKPVSPMVKPPRKQPPKPIKWNDFLRLYEKRSDQWFVSAGYGINYINNVPNSVCGNRETIMGHSIGMNVGYRHALVKNLGIGYQAGIGAGLNNNLGTYLHWALGVKFYPWTCFFVSANYGAVGMKKNSIEKLQTHIDEPFYYYKKVSTKFYHGLYLLGGADICFGKKTTDKFGGIINIAAGAVYTQGKWGWTVNIGMGFVFRK